MLSAKFILERHIPSDPYESHEMGYEITYQEAVDVAELASEISRDNLVYTLIVALGGYPCTIISVLQDLF